MPSSPIILVLGRTASGKSTLLDAIREEGKLKVHKVVTTRPRREGESDDAMEFIDNIIWDKFLYQDRLVAKRSYNTLITEEFRVFHYGLETDSLLQGGVAITDWAGYVELSSDPRFIGKLLVIYVECSADECERRASSRPGYVKQEFRRRMDTDDSTLSPEAIHRQALNFPIYSINGELPVEDMLEHFNEILEVGDLQ